MYKFYFIIILCINNENNNLFNKRQQPQHSCTRPPPCWLPLRWRTSGYWLGGLGRCNPPLCTHLPNSVYPAWRVRFPSRTHINPTYSLPYREIQCTFFWDFHPPFIYTMPSVGVFITLLSVRIQLISTERQFYHLSSSSNCSMNK